MRKESVIENLIIIILFLQSIEASNFYLSITLRPFFPSKQYSLMLRSLNSSFLYPNCDQLIPILILQSLESTIFMFVS